MTKTFGKEILVQRLETIEYFFMQFGHITLISLVFGGMIVCVIFGSLL